MTEATAPKNTAQPPRTEQPAAPLKDLYEVGEIPPLGHVPPQMYAWAIRRERHGAPEDSMQLEVVDTPEIDSDEVLVLVMAAGVNYNGIWAGLGIPISPFDVHKAEYHIAGSDASDATAPPFVMGRKCLLHPDTGHRVPHAFRTSPTYSASGPQRPCLGRFRRSGVDGNSVNRYSRGKCNRCYF